MDPKEKAELYDMWECVHKMDSVYDFDSSLSAELRRVSGNGTIGSEPGLSRETIVPGQRNDCPAHRPTSVPQVKCSPSVGYINNGTVGQ